MKRRTCPGQRSYESSVSFPWSLRDNFVRSGRGHDVASLQQRQSYRSARRHRSCSCDKGRGLELGSVEIGHSIRREVPHDI